MIKIYRDIEQGSGDWHSLRLGVITASVVKDLVTPTFKIANNDKTRAIIYSLAAERITKQQRESYQSLDMLRGHIEEEYARELYAKHYNSNIEQVGFIINNKYGFDFGFSPDWLVEKDGFAEAKSANQTKQVKTIVDDICPPEHLAQILAGFIVSEREYCDYVSYSNGMEMFVRRVYPDLEKQEIIIEACKEANKQIDAIVFEYKENAKHLYKAERRELITDEINIGV